MREEEMPNRRQALPLLACMVLAAQAFGAENSFDGTYTGERVLTKGDPAARGAKSLVSGTINGTVMTVTHDVAKCYAMGFFPKADGSFGALAQLIHSTEVRSAF
jgi:hypothetical protein